MQELQTDPWTLYIYSLKSPASKEKYPKRLAKLFEHIGLPADKMIEEQSKIFAAKAAADPSWAFNSILKFVIFQLERVERKEIVAATLRGYLKSIKLFCEVADIPIAWKKITRGIPRERRYAVDRAPTIEEIRKLVEYPERRLKAIIFSMCSGGFRLGAWDYLRWGHVEPIDREGRIVAAKVTIYAGEDEEYYTFISPEAYSELASWMKSREDAGEKITKESWLMRDLWDTRVRRGQGKLSEPKKLESIAIKRLIERAHWAQGLRTKLPEGKKRHPYQAVHSLRKYFKTKCEAGGMKPINVETLMGLSNMQSYIVDVIRDKGSLSTLEVFKIVRLRLFESGKIESRFSLDVASNIVSSYQLITEIPNTSSMYRMMKSLENRGLVARLLNRRPAIWFYVQWVGEIPRIDTENPEFKRVFNKRQQARIFTKGKIWIFK